MKEKLPVRKPLRMNYYDYNTPGAYFLTFCTHDRKHMLSRITGAIHEVPIPQLTEFGKIVESVIRDVPAHLHVTVDRYVIMPNHVHLIAMVTEEDVLEKIRKSPAQARSIVSKLVGYIKMNASKAIRNRCPDITVWQRGYYDHVIRDREDYEALAKYIYENPVRWELDKLYKEDKSLIVPGRILVCRGHCAYLECGSGRFVNRPYDTV